MNLDAAIQSFHNTNGRYNAICSPNCFIYWAALALKRRSEFDQWHIDRRSLWSVSVLARNTQYGGALSLQLTDCQERLQRERKSGRNADPWVLHWKENIQESLLKRKSHIEPFMNQRKSVIYEPERICFKFMELFGSLSQYMFSASIKILYGWHSSVIQSLFC